MSIGRNSLSSNNFFPILPLILSQICLLFCLLYCLCPLLVDVFLLYFSLSFISFTNFIIISSQFTSYHTYIQNNRSKKSQVDEHDWEIKLNDAKLKEKIQQKREGINTRFKPKNHDETSKK